MSDNSRLPAPNNRKPTGNDRSAETRPPSGDEHLHTTRAANIFWGTMAGALGIVMLLMLSSGLGTTARGMMSYLGPLGEPIVRPGLDAGPAAESVFSLQELDIHPDVVHQPYTSGELLGMGASTPTSRMIREFRRLLDLYEQRQGVDDNFTIRVFDNRTDEILEIYELTEERRAYEERQTGTDWDWDRIDRQRRELTRRLVDKHAAGNTPRDAVTVRWGRRNQVLEARERERGLIVYEVRLARYLGMSLLLTEIGTVETFNDDRLVSPVGARSRYQMMPYILRQNDVHHYRVETAGGRSIDVYEEWHPLLTMEPAFLTAAGYTNAVGHEIPGLSAYHTGPGNIYMVYRQFLTAGSDLITQESTVMDAYMWAVTTGYDTVSRRSSFQSYSRGYVASAYGALRAVQSQPIDTTRTLRADRVQLHEGASLYLSELLRALRQSEVELDWGPGTENLAPYDRFRSLNGHFDLPDAPETGPGLTPANDIELVARAQGHPVRFFLPPGASRILETAGLHVIDPEKTFRFSDDTYRPPHPSEITEWDRRYAELVKETARFGFTYENRRQLGVIVERFEELARSNPTHYRRTQLDIIRTHERIWGADVFNKLVDVTAAARGSMRFEPRPPERLPSSSLTDQQ
ncbi:MAG: hypothetical protein WD021_00115 [Rhodothermales bacterium]